MLNNNLMGLRGNKLVGVFCLVASLLYIALIWYDNPIYLQLFLVLLGLFTGIYMLVTNSIVPGSKILGLIVFYASYYAISYAYVFIFLSAFGLYLIIFTNKSLSEIFTTTRVTGMVFVVIGVCFSCVGLSLFKESFIHGVLFTCGGLAFIYNGVYSIKTNRLPNNNNGKYHGKQFTDQKGKQGEKNIAYILNWLDKNKFKVFNDVKLKCNAEGIPSESQQFDHLVISPNGIFNIETKNYSGDIEINQDGSWTRVINGERRGWESPLFQMQRHRKVLENILGKNYPIIDIVAIANTHSNITGQKNATYHIVKADMLQYFIEQFKPESGSTFDIKEVENIISSHIVSGILVCNTALAVGTFITVMLLNILTCYWIQDLQAIGFSNFCLRLLS